MTPMARRTSLACVSTLAPATSAVPPDGGSSVVSMRISVDLPAPLGPSMPKISPSATLNEMPATAVKSPKRLVSPRTSMAATSAPHRQRHVGGQPHRQLAVVVVDAQPDLEG